MSRSFTSTGPIISASLAAGPIFLVSTGLAALYLELPRPVIVESSLIAPIILSFIPAIVIGFVLSVAPNTIGNYLLTFTGRIFPVVRARPVWIATGALLGTATAGLTGAFAEPPVAFGLILTSACCAAICRLSAYWD